MKFNLRTVIILVIFISSLSIIYQVLLMQLLLISVTSFLYLITGVSKKNIHKILHRLKNIGRIIFTLMIFQIIFRHGGEVYFEYGFLKITSEGVNYGVVSSLRFFLIIINAGLLFDFPFTDYLLGFKAWKIPYEISFMVASIIHFIPIFSKQFQVTMEALHLRGISFKTVPILKRVNMFSTILFPVLAKAISNVKYRAISLELKGFRLYKDRTDIYESKLAVIDYLVQIFSLVIFILVLIFF